MLNKPYPFQLANVEWMLNKRSGFILDEPGLGKSVTSALLIDRVPGRWLIVAPASVRSAWRDRLDEWTSTKSYARIAKGIGGTSMTAPERNRQEVLRTADVLICSYDLMEEFIGDGYQFAGIILDEIHELVSYRAKVRKLLANLFAANPDAYKVGLTATPMTAEPRNTVNILDLFEPGKFGPFTKSGDPPFKFVKFYGNPKESEWAASGYTYSGLREDRAPAFRKLIADRSRRTLREEVSDLLPKVDFRALVIDFDDKRPQVNVVTERVDIMAAESPHIAIFTKHQEKALEIYNKLASLPRYQGKAILYLDGRTEASSRAALIEAHRLEASGILVGTIGALGTGIDLTFVGQYLVAEAITTAHLLTQLDGRFRRLSSIGRAPTIGWAIYREGTDDDVRAKQIERMKAYAALVTQSIADKALLTELENKPELDMANLLDRLAGSFRGDAADDEEETDDG